MHLRHALWLAVAAVWSMGASYRTPNFAVEAPTPQIAQQVGQYAEHYRREKAIEWLGKEMPNWGQPCPLKVTVTPGGAGGATSFAFDHGRILHQEMNVQGPLERILASVLPHEVTHTVFAYHFREPLPRWADEGGSVLSEDDIERRRHDEMVRHILAGGRAFRLRVLFNMKDYPTSGGDVATLYAQGYSICRFLVESSSRQGFLNFVGHGMRHGWDSAAQTFYRMNRLEELEQAWLDWMRGVYRAAPTQLVRNSQPGQSVAGRPLDRQEGRPMGRPVDRPEGRPVAYLQRPQEVPIVRAQTPVEEYSYPAAASPVRDGWSPVSPQPGQPLRSQPHPTVRLMPPETHRRSP